MDLQDRFRGCLLGLACGDAVGTTVEFCARGKFTPVTDLVGGGVFGLEPGEWTDDTSMALCLATSLTELGRFDPVDQLNRYWKWVDEGYLSSNGRCFDVGNTVYDALERFRQTGEPLSGSADPRSAGNGCIMRLAPVPMFFHPNHEQAVEMSGESSRTTHGAPECVEACRLLGGILSRTLAGANKEEALLHHGVTGLCCDKILAISRGAYRTKSESEIKGSGYVVHSLEAALWCFWHADDFREAVLRAANLGDDADTTAAVCGQIAGAHFGESGVPKTWLDRLVMYNEIRGLADCLQQKGKTNLATCQD
ncbi:MAG TPA: ADP-ribosylglycohydrolase family protein [Pirellulales bacterium]|nr:ADP-ribosylglycohydrolase family protein [Pirellulales bacterium]